MANYYQKKKIDEQLRKNRESFDIDKAESEIRQMLILNGLNTSEISAVLFTIMRNVLMYESNKGILDQAGVENLSVDAVLEIQKVLIKGYANGLNDTKSAKET